MTLDSKHHKSGFVLVLTVIILTLIILLLNSLFQRSTVQVFFDQAMIDREKAKSLALGGIQLAISQLIVDQTSTGTSTQQESSEKKFLSKILPYLNRWQEFSLKKDIDGIDGMIALCISCENGKIDINQLFDFKLKKFYGEGTAKDAKKTLQAYFGAMKSMTQERDLFGPFEKFLKERHYRLNDITELLTVKEFNTVFGKAVFYEPPFASKGSMEIAPEKRPLYLTDIFTIFSDQQLLQPWLLSDSIQYILTRKRAQPGDTEMRKKLVADALKEFNSKESTIKELWDSKLQKLYGVDSKSLAKGTEELLSPTLDPTAFSILSYGQVGKVKQKIFAIVEKSKSKEKAAAFRIKKLYWL